MSAAYISSYAGLATGTFQGACTQNAIEVFPDVTFNADNAPHLTVSGRTAYLAIMLTSPAQVYVGPAAADKATKGAFYPAGWWPISVTKGDKVYIRQLNADA